MEYEIIFPDAREHPKEEWFVVNLGGEKLELRLHDYVEIYRIPRLYERVYFGYLKCSSPKVLCDLLEEQLRAVGESLTDLRVLDFAAGSGMAGEEIRRRGAEYLAGLDILPEARAAAYRDHPNVYDEYHTLDLSRIGDDVRRKLSRNNFNALFTVSALGFGYIPNRAFLNAFNIIRKGGWLAFNLRDVSDEERASGEYQNPLALLGDSVTVFARKRYCHRLSLAGEEIMYDAIIAKKNKNTVG